MVGRSALPPKAGVIGRQTEEIEQTHAVVVDEYPLGRGFVGFEIERWERRHDMGPCASQPEEVFEQDHRHRSFSDSDEEGPTLLERDIGNPLPETARDSVGQRPGHSG